MQMENQQRIIQQRVERPGPSLTGSRPQRSLARYPITAPMINNSSRPPSGGPVPFG